MCNLRWLSTLPKGITIVLNARSHPSAHHSLFMTSPAQGSMCAMAERRPDRIDWVILVHTDSEELSELKAYGIEKQRHISG